MTTDEDIEKILKMILPFNGPLVNPVVQLVLDYQKSQNALNAALEIVRAFGENEGYLPMEVYPQSKLLESMGYKL